MEGVEDEDEEVIRVVLDVGVFEIFVKAGDEVLMDVN